jgi:Fe-S-cluster containining protein
MMSLPNEVRDQDDCKDCGACCRYLFSNVDHVIPDDQLDDILDYNKRVGVTVYRYYFNGKKVYALKVPALCRCLDEETGLCTDYENRPDVCRRFPSHYQPVMVPYCKLMRTYKKEGKI